MKELSIIMGAYSVRAILDGRKTQTRRVIKPRYKQDEYGFNVVTRPATGERLVEKSDEDGGDFEDARIVPCPYGQVGEHLWVREAGWFKKLDVFPYNTIKAYKADAWDENTKPWGDIEPKHWMSPLHMPRWASRITLEITDIRVERLQDITEDDADAELFGGYEPHVIVPEIFNVNDFYKTIPECFGKFWDSLNAKRGYPWESNPWVWVISFKVV